MYKDKNANLPHRELVPKVGLGSIQLGDSKADVQRALADYGLNVNEPSDSFCWENAWCTLHFVKQPFPHLAQIFCESEEVSVFGRHVVGLRLDEALLTLGVKRFDDTVWTTTSPDTDFAEGVPPHEVAAEPSSGELLLAGTLWIKSLALGLELHEGKVNSVSVRQPSYVPQQGCGPIDENTLLDASDPETMGTQFQSIRKKRERKSSILGVQHLLGLAAMIIAAVICWVVYTLVSDYLSWQAPKQVQGEVVALIPEGPFPDELVIEYMKPDEQIGQARVPVQYTAARELGEVVKLVYRENEPGMAMPSLQVRDHFSSLSLNWLAYLVLLVGLEISLVMLIPVFNR